MAFMVKAGGNSDPVPEGTYTATCYGIYDLGTHYDERYSKNVHKVLVCWELPSIRIEVERDGKPLDLPRAISQRYTASLSPKANLRRDLESWRGKAFTADELAGFDIKNLIGAPCLVQVVHKPKTDGSGVWANVNSIMKVPQEMPKPDQENPSAFFSFEEGTDLPERCPDWVKEIIEASQEWREAHGVPEQPAGQSHTYEHPGPPDIDTGDTDADADNLPF